MFLVFTDVILHGCMYELNYYVDSLANISHDILCFYI